MILRYFEPHKITGYRINDTTFLNTLYKFLPLRFTSAILKRKGKGVKNELCKMTEMGYISWSENDRQETDIPMSVRTK